MKNMFSGCEKLLFLDITNFNFSLTINFYNMFDNCISLIYLNIDEFETTSFYLKLLILFKL
jgi:surface protein